MKDYQKNIIVIVLLVVLANFIFWSIGFSQDGVNIQAVVPLTEKNKDIKPAQPQKEEIKTTTKENKYLYQFQKDLESKTGLASPDYQAETVYDRVASYGLMVLVLMVSAAVFLIILKLFDNFFISQN